MQTRDAICDDKESESILGFVINLSFWHSQRGQNGSLRTHSSDILSWTADDSKILGKVFCHYMDNVSRLLGLLVTVGL